MAAAASRSVKRPPARIKHERFATELNYDWLTIKGKSPHTYFLALVLRTGIAPSPSLRHIPPRSLFAVNVVFASLGSVADAAIGHWNACIYMLKLRSLYELARISTFIKSVVYRLQLYYIFFPQLSDVVRCLLYRYVCFVCVCVCVYM